MRVLSSNQILNNPVYPAAHHLLKFTKTRVVICVPVFQTWANADLNGKFKLPMKNEFIPTNFEIYPLEKDSPSFPTLIKASVVAAQLCHQSPVTLHFLTAPDDRCLTPVFSFIWKLIEMRV